MTSPDSSDPRENRDGARRVSSTGQVLEHFQCRRCGRCCEGSGLVLVREKEVEALSVALGLDPYAFTSRFTRLSADRRNLWLLDREDGACILLSPEGRCRVHSAKPSQCRDFPRKWRIPGFEQWCEGMKKALQPMR